MGRNSLTRSSCIEFSVFPTMMGELTIGDLQRARVFLPTDTWRLADGERSGDVVVIAVFRASRTKSCGESGIAVLLSNALSGTLSITPQTACSYGTESQWTPRRWGDNWHIRLSDLHAQIIRSVYTTCSRHMVQKGLTMLGCKMSDVSLPVFN